MPDKYISVQSMRKRLGIVPDGNCKKCQYGCGVGACMKPVYVEYICGELDKEPAADVVSRNCYNRILAENDTMREQLASIGKKPGDSMENVRIAKFGVWRHSWAEGRFVFRCSNCNYFLAGNPTSAKVCPGCMAEMKVEDNA